MEGHNPTEDDDQETLEEYWTADPAFIGHTHDRMSGPSHVPEVPPILFNQHDDLPDPMTPEEIEAATGLTPEEMEDVHREAEKLVAEMEETEESFELFTATPDEELHFMTENHGTEDGIEDALDDVDVDAEQIVQELDAAGSDPLVNELVGDDAPANIRETAAEIIKADTNDEILSELRELNADVDSLGLDSDATHVDIDAINALIEEMDIKASCMSSLLELESEQNDLLAEELKRKEQELAEVKREATKNRAELYANYLDGMTADMIDENDLTQDEADKVLSKFSTILRSGMEMTAEEIAESVTNELHDH